MNLDNLTSNAIGIIHFIASIFALLAGTLSLALTKGTFLHRRIGYFYTLSMSVVLSTAFMIYTLFGGWGVFHWTALISTVTLLCGMIPIVAKRPVKNYLSLHFSFMYWSVIGLYAAFVAETLVRLPKVVIESGVPNRVFYNMTGIGAGLTIAAGAFFFIKLKGRWAKQFGQK